MKVVIVDEKEFLSNTKLYTKSMQVFHPEVTENDMLTTIKNNCFYCFVFEGSEVVCWARVAKTWDRKTMYCIRQIETKAQHRGKGYAGLCYRACEDYLAKKDGKVKIIYTFVDKDNISSIRLHEKLGYKKVEKVSKYLRTFHGWASAYMYEKRIEKENIKDQ